MNVSNFKSISDIEIVKSEITDYKAIYIKESKIVDNLEDNTAEQPSLFD